MIDPETFEYNIDIHMYNPIILFKELLCSKEDAEGFITKDVALTSVISYSGSEYENIAQLNTKNNNCYILYPDRTDYFFQAQIERWIIANQVDPSEYPRLMEMCSSNNASREVKKLIKSIRR